MDPPESFSGGRGNTSDKPSPTRKELQGPRPTALKVNKGSYGIRKPPIAPQPPQPVAHNPAPPPPAEMEDRQPVIIFSVSPKVIHTTESDFRNLVQRLTGNTAEADTSTSCAAAAASGGDISPAARLASIERASPSERQKEREMAANAAANDVNVASIIESSNVEVGQLPGILSPAPSALSPISAGIFSPGWDPFMLAGNMYIPSPSTLFSAPMVSPSPSSSSFDTFNLLFDF